MVDLKLDRLTGDLDLSSGGLELVTGDEEIRQKLKIRLQFIRGEWFLDQRIGIPYRESVFVKNPDEGAIRDLYRRTILTTPGVTDLRELVIDLSPQRVLSVTFIAGLDTGGELDFDEEFIL